MSQVKLNLGCGVFPFPYTRDNVPNHDHIMPLPDICFEDGWINIDKHAAPGVQEQINLFRFPWIRSSNGNPFNNNSVDVIYAAHIVEHVPHEVKPSTPLFPEVTQMCDELDGFFVFMAECYRVLKPNGYLYVRCPYATCYSSLSDPTHTRYITPGTFGYLAPRNDLTPFDYQVPCHFEEAVELGGDTFILRTVKDVSDYSSAGLERMLKSDYSIADEIRIILRAVKD